MVVFDFECCCLVWLGEGEVVCSDVMICEGVVVVFLVFCDVVDFVGCEVFWVFEYYVFEEVCGVCFDGWFVLWVDVVGENCWNDG